MTPEQYAKTLERKPVPSPQEFKVVAPIETVQEIAAQIITENPLEEFCRKEGIALKREGPLFVGLCPFHDENTPSFKVFPDNHFHCFGSGCGKHGDIINLYQDLHECDFKETCRHFGHNVSRLDDVVAIYPYVDEKGNELSEILRKSYPKRFLIRHKKADGTWDWSKQGVRIVPYHLDEIITSDEIWIVEGEKDADTLRKLHLVATCNPFGGEKWRSDFAQYFQGKSIYICPDTDEPGRKHCLQVGQNLLPVAKQLQVVTLPKGFKDVTELFENQPNAFEERLRNVCLQAKPFTEFEHGTNGQKDIPSKLTILTLSQILAYEDDPSDLILANGYMEKGSPCVFCGPPGVGKSRLAMQLAIKAILGEGFIGWITQAEELRWLFLQSENGQRRLKHDLRLMTENLSSMQLDRIEKHLFVHSLVTDIDGYLNLSDPDSRKRVIEAIGDYKPHIVVGDPLSAMSSGDLNTDKDMLDVARDFGRIVRKDQPKGAPMIIHHAKPGRNAAAGATGFDRGAFARNSKALLGWTRAQINLVPYNENNNDKLVVASAKCSNAQEFEPFVIALDKKTMLYECTADQLEEFEERVKPGGSQKKFSTDQILKVMSTAVPLPEKQIMKEVCASTKMSPRTFYSLWKDLKALDQIEQPTQGKWSKLP